VPEQPALADPHRLDQLVELSLAARRAEQRGVGVRGEALRRHPRRRARLDHPRRQLEARALGQARRDGVDDLGGQRHRLGPRRGRFEH
jgi:hypothetical protein